MLIVSKTERNICSVFLFFLLTKRTYELIMNLRTYIRKTYLERMRRLAYFNQATEKGVAIIDVTDGKQTIVADERTMKLRAKNITYIYTKNGEIQKIKSYGKQIVPPSERLIGRPNYWEGKASV